MSNSLPDQIQVIEICQPGGPEVLVPTLRPLPRPSADDVLIKNSAVGVNRPDVMQRKGNYPPPPGASDIPGLEIAGKVVAIGKNVTGWSIGDNACALVSGGGYAEYCIAPAPQCLPIPSGLSMTEAAALPETYFTVWDNLFTRGKLSDGETLLVHGGSSGIGTTAIQMARAFGAKVLVTAGSSEKCSACEKLGAVRAINYRDEDFVAVAKEFTDGKGLDVILDMVGGDYVGRNLDALAKGGRLVQIAVQKGTKAEIAAHLIMVKQIVFTGSTLRPRSISEKATIAQSLANSVWPLIEKGEIKPLIHATFPLKNASNAHALMDTGTHIGKIVLTV